MTPAISKTILNSIQEAKSSIEQLEKNTSLEFIMNAATMLATSFKKGDKVIIAGNGGSLCDGAHFAEELTGQFRRFRPALPAISLSDSSHITCVANDMGFDLIFSRGLEALGREGDVFVGLTTSGNSINIVNAFKAAKAKGMSTIAFLGKSGGKLRGVADLELIIEGFTTSDRIQEAHMAAIHIIIEVVEQLMFSKIETD